MVKSDLYPIHSPNYWLSPNPLINVEKAYIQDLLGAVYFYTKTAWHFWSPVFRTDLQFIPITNYEPSKEKLIQTYDKMGQSHQVIYVVEQRIKSQQKHHFLMTVPTLTIFSTCSIIDKAIQIFKNSLDAHRIPKL